MKKLISFTIAMILTMQPMSLSASENSNNSDILLAVVPQTFSAIVPTQLPVQMSANGAITVAKDVSITNTSNGPIIIDRIEITNVKSDWGLVDFDDDFSGFKVGSKKLAMSFNGDKSITSGDIPLRERNLTPIDGFGSMHLNYDAKIPAQNIGLVDEIPANVVFTLRWHEAGIANIVENNPTTYEFVPEDTKVLTINFKGVSADNDTVTWSSSNEAVATVAVHETKGRAMPLMGSKQCVITAMGSGTTTITGMLSDGTHNSFEVVVVDKNVSSIVITKIPDKISYLAGETFDQTGMIVTANYNNGTSSDINDYVIVNGDTLILGKTSVVISYKGKSTNQNITIEDIPIGTKYIEGNYEYSYKQRYSNTWKTIVGQEGFGIRVIDKTQTDYISPLNMVYGKPVTNMSYLFYNSPTITLNLIDWDTSNVTDMNQMFSQSVSTNINGLNNFDTSKVTNMTMMFFITKAKTLDVSSFDTSSVTDMSAMFRSGNVKVLDIGKFNTSNVTTMSTMFSDSIIEHLDLSNFNTSKVTDMYGMFVGCDARSVNLSGFDTSKVTDMEKMFSSSLATNIDVSMFDTSNVTNMKNMFFGSSATNLDLSSFNTSKVTSMYRMFSSSATKNIILSSFDTSKVTDMSGMFQNSRIETLNLSNFDTSSLIDTSYMFFNGWAITDLNLSNFNTSKVTNMSNMFELSNLTHLDISSFDSSNVTNTTNMFNESKIKNLTVRTQLDADKYQSSSGFPVGATITVKM